MLSIITRIEKEFPQAVLQKRAFGRAGARSVWIESRSLPEIAESLKNHEESAMDWLENISMFHMEKEKALVATYFLSSFTPGAFSKGSLILRASVELSDPDQIVEMPSVSSVWKMAAPMEAEISDLFGVRFTGETVREPTGWTGFPLRKNYQFPTEVGGIAHSRPPGRPGGLE